MKNKILLYNYNTYQGGPLVTSVLCKTLRDLGYDARLVFPYSLKRKNRNRIYLFIEIVKMYCVSILQVVAVFYHKYLPFITIFEKFLLQETPVNTIEGIKVQQSLFFNRSNTIVIYPEVVGGNPLLSKYVVRWLLSKQFTLPHDQYSPIDLFVCYRKHFNDIKLNPNNYCCHINYFDFKLYHCYNYGHREGNCYILRKGRHRIDLPKSFDGPVFDNDMSQKDVVKMFNECKYCYSYDTQTFYCVIAAVCGCIPIIVLEPGKKMEDYRDEGERNHYGIAFGDTKEQIEYAISTRSKLLESLDYSESNKQNALQLVEIMESHFGKIKKCKQVNET